MKKLFVLITAFVFCLKMDAQNPFIQWQKTFGGSGLDLANSIIKTTDGGYAVAGRTESNDTNVLGNHGNSDYWIVKLDSTGIKQWAYTFGGTAYDEANCIIQTTDGGYAVAGYTQSNDGDVIGNHGSNDYWVLKLSSTGLKQWAYTYGGTSVEVANSIIQTTDGGFAVAGTAISNDGDVTGNHGNYDYWVVKLSSSGIKQWQKTYGGSVDDEAYSIIAASDGGYAITGKTSSSDGDITSNHGNYDYWVVKISNTGVKQWAYTYGGTSDDYARSIIRTVDGSYTVAGYTSSNNNDVTGNHGNSDYWIVKIDTAGVKQWAYAYGGTGIDYAQSIIQTIDSGYAVVGYTGSSNGDVSGNHGNYDYWLLKLSGAGVKQWAYNYGGTYVEYGHSIIQTTDGGYAIAGKTSSNDGDVSGNHGDYDIWVVKIGVFNVNLGASQVVCSGNTISLNPVVSAGTSPYTYTWSGTGNNLSCNNCPNPTTTITQNSSYTVTVTGSNLATASASVAFTVNPTPTVTVHNPATICLTATVDLTSSSITSGSTAGLTYTYWTSSQATNSYPTPTAAAGGTYYIKGTTALGCYSIQPVVVTTNPPATVNAGFSQTICQSGTVFLGGSISGSATSSTWSAATGSFSNINSLTSTYTPSIATGNVTLTLTTDDPSGPCPAAISSTTITVQMAATANAGFSQSVCTGGSVTLAGSIGGSAVSSTWSAPSGSFSDATSLTSSYTPSIPSGTVTLTLTTNDPDGAGPCTGGVSTVTITVNQSFTVNAGPNIVACQSSSPTAITLTGASVSGGATTGAWSITSGGGALSSTSQTATPALVTYTPAPNFSGTVTLTLTTNDPAGPCSSVSSIRTITVNPTPTVTIHNPNPVCLNATVDLTSSNVTFGSTIGLTYTYWTNAGTTTSLSSPNAVGTSGTYYIKGTSTAGCFSIQPVIVSITSSAINQTTTTTDATCSNVYDGEITVTVGGGVPPYNYSLNGGPTQFGNVFTGIQSGNYTVYVYDATGCLDTSHAIINDTYNVSPSVVTQTDVSCLGGNNGAVTVQLIGGTPSFSYSISNGTTFQGSPTFSGLSAGNYSVILRDSRSCTASQSITIAQPAPLNSITISAGAEPICQLANGTTTTAYSTSASGITNFHWTLSNSSAGSIDSSTGVMTWANGFFGSVNVRVCPIGCDIPSATIIRTVTVGNVTVGTPTAITVQAGTEPVCQLTNGSTTTTYSTTATGSTGFNWSLSNASAGSINSSTGVMTWANGYSGTVNIQVTANGCNGPSVQVVRTVTISNCFGVNLGSDQTVCGGTAVSLNPSISGGTGPYNYLWTSTGNSLSCSNCVNPTVTITQNSTYTVTVTDNTGASATASVSFTIQSGSAPTASFTINDVQQCQTGNSFTFTSTSIVGGGTITNFSWSFGSLTPTSANGTPKTISFTNTGTDIPVTLTVTTNSGCVATSAVQTISIFSMPDSSFTYPSVICQKEPVTFTQINNSSGTKSWTWGDGTNSPNLTTQTANHIFQTYSQNTFPVKLLVTTNPANGSCTTELTKNVTVYPLPVVDFTIDDSTQCRTDNLFHFTNTSTLFAGSGSSIPNPLGYVWSFGDLGFHTGSNQTNSYTMDGTYSVKLRITTDKGCSDSLMRTAIVNKTPTVSITSTPFNNICSDTVITLTTTTTNGTNPTHYIWSPSNDTTANISFASAAPITTTSTTYSVTVTDANGCSGITAKTVTINPLPNATITPPNTISICLGDTIELTAVSGNSYHWSNNTTSSSIKVAEAGAYSLTATNSYSCSASAATVVNVLTSPILPPTVTDATDFISPNGSIVINTINGGPYTYSWSTGDNTSSISGIPPGEYFVTVTGSATCVDSISITVNFATGITSMDGNDWVKIFPNPASDVLFVCSSTTIEIVLIDLTGRLINRFEIDGDRIQTIDITNLSGGAYTISIFNKETAQTRALKWIKF